MTDIKVLWNDIIIKTVNVSDFFILEIKLPPPSLISGAHFNSASLQR